MQVLFSTAVRRTTYVQYLSLTSQRDSFVCRYNVRLYVHVVGNEEAISLHPPRYKSARALGRKQNMRVVCVNHLWGSWCAVSLKVESGSEFVSQSWRVIVLRVLFSGNSNLWQCEAVGDVVVGRSRFWLRLCRNTQTRIRVTNLEVRYVQWQNAVLWHSCMNINMWQCFRSVSRSNLSGLWKLIVID